MPAPPCFLVNHDHVRSKVCGNGMIILGAKFAEMVGSLISTSHASTPCTRFLDKRRVREKAVVAPSCIQHGHHYYLWSFRERGWHRLRWDCGLPLCTACAPACLCYCYLILRLHAFEPSVSFEHGTTLPLCNIGARQRHPMGVGPQPPHRARAPTKRL